nr:helix-turn-helix domain-containing protein [uncultured Draconibacterium sp.]
MKLTPEFLDRPVYTLTVRELIELNQIMDKQSHEPEKEKIEIRGIHALAKFLKVSATTAQKLKNSGKIPYSQIGKLVLFDGNKVLEALEK